MLEQIPENVEKTIVACRNVIKVEDSGYSTCKEDMEKGESSFKTLFSRTSTGMGSLSMSENLPDPPGHTRDFHKFE